MRQPAMISMFVTAWGVCGTACGCGRREVSSLPRVRTAEVATVPELAVPAGAQHRIPGPSPETWPERPAEPVDMTVTPIVEASSRCERAAGRVLEILYYAPALPPARVEEWRHRFIDAIATSCRADGWPPALLDCFASAGPEHRHACTSLMEEDVVESAWPRLKPLVATFLAELNITADTQLGTGVCSIYVAELRRLMACERIPQHNKDEAQKWDALWLLFEQPDDYPPSQQNGRAAEALCRGLGMWFRLQRALAGCPS